MICAWSYSTWYVYSICFVYAKPYCILHVTFPAPCLNSCLYQADLLCQILTFRCWWTFYYKWIISNDKTHLSSVALAWLGHFQQNGYNSGWSALNSQVQNMTPQLWESPIYINIFMNLAISPKLLGQFGLKMAWLSQKQTKQA